MRKLFICVLLLCVSACAAESVYGGALDACPMCLSEPHAPSGLTRMFSTEVGDTTVYPYSAIGIIDSVFDCGCKKSGTVFMVGKFAALTASHCVVCPEHNGRLKSTTFRFGVRGDGSALVRYTDCITYWYGSTFPDGYTAGAQRMDYAYIRFERDIGSTTGWFGTTVFSDSDFANASLLSAGYSDGVLTYARGTASVYDVRQITVSMPSDPGNSGAPIYTEDNYAVGITTCFTDEGIYYACRILDFHINELIKNGLAEG